MSRPPEARYLKSHEWALKQGDLIIVGVSDYAIEQLNKEIVYIELPEVGRTVTHGQPMGVIEAVKAAFDLYAPVSGRIAEANNSVVENPAMLADDPFRSGWIVKIEPSNVAEWDSLMSASEYEKFLESGDAH